MKNELQDTNPEIKGEYEFGINWEIIYFWDIEQIDMIIRHILDPFDNLA